MAGVKALSAYKMAKRIYNREDNVYDKKVITKQLITNILLMYMAYINWWKRCKNNFTGGYFLSVLIENMEKECYNIHRNQCILYNGEYANGKL